MNEPKRSRFLVLSPQGFGDSLEATPLVRALRRARPDARIDVAVTRGGPKLLFESLRDYVDEVIYLPFWEGGARRFVTALARSRRGRRYDQSFLAFPSARPAYEVLSAAFPAARRFAHRHARRMLLDLPGLRAQLVPVRRGHNVERNRDLLRAAGIPPGEDDGYLIPATWVAPPAERKPDRIAMHIGTVAHNELAFRRWPLQSFIALAKRLVAEHRNVTLIVGPEEREESLALCEQVPQIERMEGTLPEVARFLSTCKVLVSNDSGIAHLGAGVGARAVTLFGPTSVEGGPFVRDAILLRPSSCPPCFDIRHPVVRCVRKIDFQCLKQDLTVDLVAMTVAQAAVAPRSEEPHGQRAGAKSGFD